jgi:hypothetical protein
VRNDHPGMGDIRILETPGTTWWSRMLASDAAIFARRLWILWLFLQVIGIMAVFAVFPYDRTFPSDSDIILYWTWSSALWQGAIPYHSQLAVPMVYPPGMLPILALPSFSISAFRYEYLLVAFAVDALVLRALLRAERRIGAIGWVLASLLLGPIFWCRLDIFVAAMLVAAVLSFEKRHYGWAAFWIAWAGLIKIWPLLLLVLLYRLVPPEQRRRFAGIGTGMVAICVLPFLELGGASGLWYVVQQQAGRGVEIESLFAAPLYLLKAVGEHVTVVHAPASLQFAGGADSVVAAVSTGLMVCAVLYLLRRGVLRPIAQWDAASWLLVVVVVLLLTDRVLSPQYLVWTAAAVALFVDRCRFPLRLLGVTALLLVATQLQFPFGFETLITGTNLALALSAIHGAVLLSFGIVALRCVQSADNIRDIRHSLQDSLSSTRRSAEQLVQH